jgi:hypothetical protein
MLRAPLSRTGALWTYTVCHHRPPGSRRLSADEAPFALGLVELDEGVRVLAPVEVDVDQLTIGLRLELRPLMLDSDVPDEELIGYAFGPAPPGAGA